MDFGLGTVDTAIIVALIGLVGTIYTIRSNIAIKKQDAIIATNKQLMEMLEKSNGEINRLEGKIQTLTTENTELREELKKLNALLLKLGINV